MRGEGDIARVSREEASCAGCCPWYMVICSSVGRIAEFFRERGWTRRSEIKPWNEGSDASEFWGIELQERRMECRRKEASVNPESKRDEFRKASPAAKAKEQ